MKVKKYTPPAELKRTVIAKTGDSDYAKDLDSLPERTPDNKHNILKAVVSAAAMLIIGMTVTALALIAPLGRRKKPQTPASPGKENQQTSAPATESTEMFFINGNLIGGTQNGKFVFERENMNDCSLATLLSSEALYTAGADNLYGVYILISKENEKYAEYATGQYQGYYYVPLGTEVDEELEIPTDGIAFSSDEIDNTYFHDFVTTAKIERDDEGRAYTDMDGDGNKEYLSVEEITASLIEYGKDGNAQVLVSAPITLSPSYSYLTREMLARYLTKEVFDTDDTTWYKYSQLQQLTKEGAATVVNEFCEAFCLKVPQLPELSEYYSDQAVKQYAKDVAGLIKRTVILPKADDVVLNGVRISDDDFSRLCDYLAKKEASAVTFTGDNHVATPTAHSLKLDNRSILVTKDSLIINRIQFKFDEEFLKPIHECSLLNAKEYDITVSYNGQTIEISGHDMQYFILSSLSQWRPGTPECAHDVEITVNGQKMYYHTECTSLSVNGGSFIGDTSLISRLIELKFK